MRVFLKASPVIACATSVLLLCFSPASNAWGQAVATGTVSGIVTDPSGGVIVDAGVTLTETTTNIERKVTTNDTGHYSFPNVPPGVYDVTVAKQGCL